MRIAKPRPDADPAELRLLHVRRGVVQHGHGQHDTHQDYRPLGDVPCRHGDRSRSDRVADRFGYRPADHQHHRYRGGQQQARQGENELQRPQLPDRAALLDLVDPVHRPPERADVTRRRPQRRQRAGDQCDAGRRRCHQLLDGRTQQVHRVAGNHARSHLQHRVDGSAALPDNAEQRDQHQQRRKQ